MYKWHDKNKLYSKIDKLDNKGQLSLEYVLVFMMGILILTLISFPLVNYSIDSINDVLDSINSKSELEKLSDAIDYCYVSGKGSKRVVLLDFRKNNYVNLISSNNNKTIIKSNVYLNNGELKNVSIESDASFDTNSLSFTKGFNKIIIQWSDYSNNLIIRKLN